MSKKKFSWEDFSKVPIVGIVRNLSLEQIKTILPIYVESGLTTIEITMNTPSAADIIKYCVDHYGHQLNIGAGTVCNLKDLKEALSAGSQFIVTPIIDKKVIRKCVKEGVPVFPGAYTPTEIYKAWKWGASIVKVYPATSLEAQFIKDVKAPLNQIKLLPTGGINLENLSEFMKMGADGLGVGGQLFDKQLIEEEDWDGLKRHFEDYVNTIKKRD
jgi:2-dehydro-3-deoxyphosphogluconate aldolase/(4S)-4-hydroxy-2-oxoglutarate aldolase